MGNHGIVPCGRRRGDPCPSSGGGPSVRQLLPRALESPDSCDTFGRMTRQKVLDLYFMDARCKLIEIAAFLDRVDRAEGPADFRWEAFRQALTHLGAGDAGRAEAVLRSLSDPTEEPVPQAPGKGAVGAWPGRP